MINELNEVNENENYEDEFLEHESEIPIGWENNIIFVRNAIGDVQTLTVVNDRVETEEVS